MKKDLTIRKNRDFKRVYNRGKSIASPHIVTYILKNRFKKSRIGITSSKKVGNAVCRNRARRVIRAAIRNLSFELRQGFDIVFVARAKTSSVKMQDVLKDMEYQLKKIDVVK